MRKKILVTGSCGLIGSNFVSKLLNYDFDLVLIDNFSTGFKKNLINIKKKAKLKKKNIFFYEINLINKKQLKNIFLDHKIYIIFHFAAFSNVNESKKNPKKFFTNNVISTDNLLQNTELFKIKYFIFSSSAAVYGNTKFKTNIRENTFLKPISAYGKSKKISENNIIKYSKNNDLKYCILRYFNVVGKDLGNNFVKKKNFNLFEKLEHFKTRNKTIKIFGKNLKTYDGTPVRDFIFIDDLINAHLICLKKINHKKFWNDIYNVGYNKGYSVLDVILEHNKYFNNKIRYKLSNMRKGEIVRSVANTNKFLKKTNWRPKMNNLKKIIISFFKN